jgi:hypothetical protein
MFDFPKYSIKIKSIKSIKTHKNNKKETPFLLFASENRSSKNVGSPHIFSSNTNENDQISILLLYKDKPIFF